MKTGKTERRLELSNKQKSAVRGLQVECAPELQQGKEEVGEERSPVEIHHHHYPAKPPTVVAVGGYEFHCESDPFELNIIATGIIVGAAMCFFALAFFAGILGITMLYTVALRAH